MALLHQATLTPSKAELMASWLPQQEWFDGDASQLRPIASFRLDDPDGEVGIELMLLRAGEDRWFVPLTYRAAPLDGGAGHLVGVLEHSVLGTRHVYDGTGDPVFVDVARSTISGRGRQADLVRERSDGTREAVEPTMTAHGTGGDGVDVVLERRPVLASDADRQDGSGALIGVPAGEPAVVLARLL